ncbi:MAG: PA2778 family cysteine peptidase [Woeseia sp.]
MSRYAKTSLALVFFCCLLVTGCASTRLPVVDTVAIGTVPELTDTPFHPQALYQCGPAALLTLLDYSGVATDMDTLVRQVYLPGREGSLQPELLAATRAAERVPYRIDGTIEALAAEIRAGRPVLVLQNLGVSWLPRWHYAVVIGVDAPNGQVVLRSGVDARRVTKLTTFMRTWRRSDYWGMVALRADELPVNVDRGRWFSSLSALEQTGRHASALRAWKTAVDRWPDSAVGWFGLANSHYVLQDWPAAELGYRRLLRLQPSLAIARNNLALALMQQRRFAEAEQEAMLALSDSSNDAEVQAEVERTLAEIRDTRVRRE